MKLQFKAGRLAELRKNRFQKEVKHDDAELGINQMKANVQIYENFQLNEDIYQAIQESLENRQKLCMVLQDVFNRSNPQIFYAIIQSDLYDQILLILDQSNDSFLFYNLYKIATSVANVTILTISKGIIPILFRNLQSIDPKMIHVSMKFIRRIIYSGFQQRVFLFASNFYGTILNLLRFPPSPDINFKYIAHTILKFVRYDPVYSAFGYIQKGGDLPQRSEVIQSCKIVGFSPKVLLTVSHFLKYGNQFRSNKALYHILPFFLESNDIKTAEYAITVISELSIFCEENVHSIVSFKYFSDLIKKWIHIQNQEIIIQIMTILTHITYYTGSQYQNLMMKCDVFHSSYHILFNSPPDVQFATSRFLVNASSTFENVILECSDARFVDSLINLVNDSTFNVKNESCWFLINILDYCSNKLQLISDELILTFFDFLENGETGSTELLEPILCLFIELSQSLGDEFIEKLKKDELINSLHEICANTNGEIMRKASYLLNEIMSDENEDETDEIF